MRWWLNGFKRKPKAKVTLRAAYEPAAPEPESGTLKARMNWLRTVLDRNSDIVFQSFRTAGGRSGAVVFVQNMVDSSLFESMLENGLALIDRDASEGPFSWIRKMPEVPISSYRLTASMNETVQQILEGHLALLLDGLEQVCLFPLRKIDKRAISESANESVIRGPREAFIEDLDTNLTMIRRKIKHPALKTEELRFGKYTHTKVMLVYLDGICKKELVDEVKLRLGRIKIDGVLGSSYLEEYLEDNPYSPFPQLQYTERPDTVAAGVLEGRIAVLVDGTPIPLLLPVTLSMLLQSTEDYYQKFIAATWIRWIRYIFLVVSFLFPSVYIAISTFHPEMLPPSFLTTVAAAREGTPFPAFVEALIMELMFEALREGGLRIPKAIGQTISIIGALIIGQAAVEAGIVSAPMVIVVSITGIASFIIPHYDLGLTFRFLRFPIMFMAASFGLFGVMVAIFLLYLHLVSLRSFGTPYLSPIAPMQFQGLKDVFVRVPWWKMRRRPVLYGTEAGVREKGVNLPQLPDHWEGD
ncbi:MULTISPECIES: spore germination protein [Cohnella]|uniref:spore germination protein n=1 Tax=Cohnella TaxID=329857 RepID=UPI0009BA4E11|nr:MULTISPECIES: spore germination protein [Cohnella]MBN2984655.1 spore germination protein [Cohnella algarum]